MVAARDAATQGLVGEHDAAQHHCHQRRGREAGLGEHAEIDVTDGAIRVRCEAGHPHAHRRSRRTAGLAFRQRGQLSSSGEARDLSQAFLAERCCACIESIENSLAVGTEESGHAAVGA